MTAAERARVKQLVDAERRRRIPRRVRRHTDPEVYGRVLLACCPESTVDVEEHAYRIACRVRDAKAAA